MLHLSATTGEGLTDWYAWLRESRKTLLSSRVSQLENELAKLKAQL